MHSSTASPVPSHFIFEINIGNDEIKIDSKSIEDDAIQIRSRSASDPPFSDIDFKNKINMNYP